MSETVSDATVARVANGETQVTLTGGCAYTFVMMYSFSHGAVRIARQENGVEMYVSVRAEQKRIACATVV